MLIPSQCLICYAITLVRTAGDFCICQLSFWLCLDQTQGSASSHHQVIYFLTLFLKCPGFKPSASPFPCLSSTILSQKVLEGQEGLCISQKEKRLSRDDTANYQFYVSLPYQTIHYESQRTIWRTINRFFVEPLYSYLNTRLEGVIVLTGGQYVA